MKFLLLFFLTAALPLGGCFTSSESRTPRCEPASAAPAEVWPHTDAAPLSSLHADTPKIIPAYQLAPGASLESLSPDDRAKLNTPECTVTFNSIIGREPGIGLLRITQAPAPNAPTDPEQARLQKMFNDLLTGHFAFNASFLSSNDINTPRWRDAHEASALSSTTSLSFAPQGLVESGLSTSLGLDSGIQIELPQPHEKLKSPPRGLLFHFCTLFPNEYEHAVVDRLRADGWFVVCFDTKITVPLPRDPAAMAGLPALEARKAEIEKLNADRFNARVDDRGKIRKQSPEEIATYRERDREYAELISSISQIKRGWITLKSADEIDRVSTDLAALVDATIADNAYAAEAALQYLAEARPDIPQSPLVIVGMSAGSLAAPTVAARLGNRVNAVVLVGGGADLFDISRKSTLKRTGVQFRSDQHTQAPEELMPALHDAYLRKTKLDPYTIAPLLARTPVLTILAKDDTIVPFANGQLMYERLGKPDRTLFSMGHYELFYFLPRHANEIVRWVDRNTPRPKS